MIDLHIHTCHSDGADETARVLCMADQLGLSTISITDHNTVSAYGSASKGFKLPRGFSGKVIPGLEITCMYQGEVVEVLGYGICLPDMETALAHHVLTFEEKQKQEYQLILSTYKNLGLDLDPSLIHFDPTTESCREAVWNQLRQDPRNLKFFSSEESFKNLSAFTRQEVYNPSSPLYVDESPLYPDIHTAVDMIHSCGGIVFLAHMWLYACAGQIRAGLDSFLSEYDLDGLECAHYSFSQEQIADLNHFCLSSGYLRCGGSDYHGSRKLGVSMGTGHGQLCICEDFLDGWPAEILA